MAATRVGPEHVRRRMSEADALLVCAYDDEAKCRKYHLDGAISYNELQPRLDSISKDRELIFYCA
jgi:hypothetical protein